MKTITEAMREKLRKPLPSDAIKQHPTKTYLSTIKAIYVVERLNDVFGVGEWKTKTGIITTVDKMVVVKSILTVNGYDIEVEAFGGNDNVDLGDAYKGAATDALTKICSYLEIGIDVFKGLGDTSGKVEQVKPVVKQVEKEPIEIQQEQEEKKQKAEIIKLCEKLGITNKTAVGYEAFIMEKTESSLRLKPENYDKIITKLTNKLK